MSQIKWAILLVCICAQVALSEDDLPQLGDDFETCQDKLGPAYTITFNSDFNFDELLKAEQIKLERIDKFQPSEWVTTKNYKKLNKEDTDKKWILPDIGLFPNEDKLTVVFFTRRDGLASQLIFSDVLKKGSGFKLKEDACFAVWTIKNSPFSPDEINKLIESNRAENQWKFKSAWCEEGGYFWRDSDRAFALVTKIAPEEEMKRNMENKSKNYPRSFCLYIISKLLDQKPYIKMYGERDKNPQLFVKGVFELWKYWSPETMEQAKDKGEKVAELMFSKDLEKAFNNIEEEVDKSLETTSAPANEPAAPLQ
ncbi:MAG: hypothetical protein EBR01_13830 [Proteobacteria bacterium]|nr:hypothetical protein [Pseudomonadota bacterium]